MSEQPMRDTDAKYVVRQNGARVTDGMTKEAAEAEALKRKKLLESSGTSADVVDVTQLIFG